jgi:protein-S-isoprenylcysteine O-methyltransferase Ste14
VADIWFKLVFASTFVVAAVVAAAAARRANAQHGGSINQLSHEVRGLVFLRAAFGVVFYFFLMSWMFWSSAFRWSYLPLPVEARWTGVALLVPAITFFTWSYRTLGANYRGGVGLHARHELVTTGPYHWLRHPIYAAFIVIMLIVLLLSSNWMLGLSGLALVSIIAAVRIPVEERELQGRFGPSWERYRARAGLLLPRMGRTTR